MTKTATGGHPDLKMVKPAAAVIDIGSTLHMAAVNPDDCNMPVRAFGTFTQDLHDLAGWFDACGVTSVAMERRASTGSRRSKFWRRGFKVSMSGKGNCCDNSAVESFLNPRANTQPSAGNHPWAFEQRAA